MKLLTHYRNAQKMLHPEIMNWRENDINDSLFYSCRSTWYDPETYPARLHYHDYYELVIFQQGEIHYLCEGQVYHPRCGDVILIPPQRLHMSALNAASTLYKRHVFYLYPDALDAWGGRALLRFLEETREGGYLIRPEAREREALFSLLPQLDLALSQPERPEEAALARGLILQIFYLLNSASARIRPGSAGLPQAVRDIQTYVDAHFAEIASVEEVARHFYYSREYVSRLFKHYLHITAAEYILKRRVALSQSLIAQDTPLSDVCFQAGFRNLSTFIRSFRAVTQMTPSQYRQMLRKEE